MQRFSDVRRFACHLRAHKKPWRPHLSEVTTPTKFGALETWSFCQSYGGGRSLCCLIDQKERSSKQEEALRATLAEISKNFGAESVMWLGRASSARTIPVIPTGSLTLDSALGTGGLPKGRIVEIFGPEGSGKTTLALHIIAESQKLGGDCVFIDAEHSLDFALAEALGVKMGSLHLAQPDSWEQAVTLLNQFIRSKTVDVIVVDSVATLFTEVEKTTEAIISLQARLLSQTLRKLTHSISANKTLMIFISQTKRSKLSAVGDEVQEQNSSGNALKCYSSVRLSVQKKEQLKKVGQIRNVMVKVVKNKLAPPFKTAEFEIELGRGISKVGEVLDLAVKHGIVVKSGSSFLYNGSEIGDGRETAKANLIWNVELQETLTKYIKEKLAGDGTKL